MINCVQYDAAFTLLLWYFKYTCHILLSLVLVVFG